MYETELDKLEEIIAKEFAFLDKWANDLMRNTKYIWSGWDILFHVERFQEDFEVEDEEIVNLVIKYAKKYNFQVECKDGFCRIICVY